MRVNSIIFTNFSEERFRLIRCFEFNLIILRKNRFFYCEKGKKICQHWFFENFNFLLQSCKYLSTIFSNCSFVYGKGFSEFSSIILTIINDHDFHFLWINILDFVGSDPTSWTIHYVMIIKSIWFNRNILNYKLRLS